MRPSLIFLSCFLHLASSRNTLTSTIPKLQYLTTDGFVAKMPSQHPPSQQSAISSISPVVLLAKDLVLSLLSYIAVYFVLKSYLSYAALAYFDSGNLVGAKNLHDCRDIVYSTLVSLWVTRCVFRWRRHIVCGLHCILPCLLRFLYFLSPFGTEPHTTCHVCRPIDERNSVADRKSQRIDPHGEQGHGAGIFLCLMEKQE